MKSSADGAATRGRVGRTRLEWAYQEVLIAAESNPLNPSLLADVPVEQYKGLLFVPRNEMRLVSSAFPVLDIWKSHQTGSERTSCDIEFDRPRSNILLIRRNDHVELREIEAMNSLLLQKFMQRLPLGRAVEELTTADGFDLAANLRALLAMQTLHDCYVVNDNEA